MVIFLYVVLILIGVPLWFWLSSRISQVNHVGALLSLFLVVPAFYWCFKLWNNRRADLRMAAMANLAVNVIALPALIIFSTHYATSRARDAAVPKPNPYMERWCREKNDAVYDPVLDLCVEPSKGDVLAQEAQENVFGQFALYLKRHGLDGELDRGATPDTLALKNTPEIADVVSYRFYPLTISQAPILISLCLSETACKRIAFRQGKAGLDVVMAKGRLLLSIPAGVLDEGRLHKFKAAAIGFSPK